MGKGIHEGGHRLGFCRIGCAGLVSGIGGIGSRFEGSGTIKPHRLRVDQRISLDHHGLQVGPVTDLREVDSRRGIVIMRERSGHGAKRMRYVPVVSVEGCRKVGLPIDHFAVMNRQKCGHCLDKRLTAPAQ
jgi:hypothetical protein